MCRAFATDDSLGLFLGLNEITGKATVVCSD